MCAAAERRPADGAHRRATETTAKRTEPDDRFAGNGPAGIAPASRHRAPPAALAPLLVSGLLLSNSTAAASLNGARALEIEQDQQALLSIIVMTLGMLGFVVGVVLAAVLLGVTGFGLVLALTGLGMAATSAGFRRPLLVR